MEIGPLHRDQRSIADSPESIGNSKGRESRSAQAIQPVIDTVEISDSARAQLAEVVDSYYRTHGTDYGSVDQVADYISGEAAMPLDKELSGPERVERLRQRIEAGYYNRDDVKNEIARKITDKEIKPGDESA